MNKIQSESESIMNQINHLEKVRLKRKDKIERLQASWRSLMNNMGPSDILISTKTKKLAAHKNVLAGKNNQLLIEKCLHV